MSYQQKPASRKAVFAENDENAATTRVTRAKAAAQGGPEVDAVKKGLTRTKSTATAATAQSRKRAALGDVSNVSKQTTLGLDKNAKKPLAPKSGNVSKAAQPSRVEKVSRTQSTRSVLGPKDRSAVSSDLKRPAPASGSGGRGHVSKKRLTSSSTVESETLEAENIAPADANVKVEEVFKQTKITEIFEEVKVESEVKSMPEGVEDLDAEDVDDPLMAADYVVEIFEYLKELELTTLANSNYMDNQPDLEWSMRGILIDWLLEVHTRFRLLPETLFLAVNIIDRFLSCKVVQLDRLQLVGVTAMFIASKYEEVLSPHVTNFRHVADDGFTDDEILSAERFVLTALNYNLSYPNPMNFLRRISKADYYDVETRTVGKYLLEISCLDHRFIAYPPSQVAAAAMFFARLVLERGEWSATLEHYAGYSFEELEPCFLLMLDYVTGPVKHDAFFKKYAHKKFLKGRFTITVCLISLKPSNSVQHPWSSALGPRFILPTIRSKRHCLFFGLFSQFEASVSGLGYFDAIIIMNV
jgi:hypothetical protein